MIGALLAALLFSLSAVCATRTARMMGGTEANFWRLALAALLLGLYAHLFGAGLGGAAFALFFISGVIGFGIGDVTLFQALPRLGSRLTILLVQCLAAPLAAACEWLWLGTTLSVTEILCGLTILGGVALALAPSEHLHLERRVFWPGIVFSLLAAFGQGFGAVLSRKAFDLAHTAGQDIDGISAAYQRSIGGLLFGGLCLLIVKRQWIGHHLGTSGEPDLVADPREKWRRAGTWVFFNALAGPALGVSCFQWALKTTPTGIVLPIVSLTPLLIIPFSMRMEGEKPSRRSLVGGLIAVAGAVALATR